MAKIITVLGPINTQEIGLTSMHEHVFVNGGVFYYRDKHFIPEKTAINADEKVSLENIGLLRRSFSLTLDAVTVSDEDIMFREVLDFKNSGGTAMLDLTVPGIRMKLPAVKKIAERTGLHIIMSTGLYTEDSWPASFKDMEIKDFYMYMLGEIENGIEHTGIKAGHIKVAVLELGENPIKLIRAAARVAKETGFSITVHPGFSEESDGRKIAEIFKDENMDMERVIMAHLQNFVIERDLSRLSIDPESWCLNLDYAYELLDMGITLSVDAFGQIYDREFAGFVQPTDWQRMGALIKLIREGYSSQLVIGTDSFLKISARRFGGEGYCRLTNHVIPYMEKLSISKNVINKITVDNPIRLLQV